MSNTFDFRRMRFAARIFGVVQLFLVAVLVYMAVYFQTGLQAQGRPQRFLHSVVTTLLIQLALFYPVNSFAAKEAGREVEASAVGLTGDELKALRKKRLIADAVKAGILVFFITFILKAPQDPFAISIIFYSCIATVLTYFQCYNFWAKRLMEERR